MGPPTWLAPIMGKNRGDSSHKGIGEPKRSRPSDGETRHDREAASPVEKLPHDLVHWLTVLLGGRIAWRRLRRGRLDDRSVLGRSGLARRLGGRGAARDAALATARRRPVLPLHGHRTRAPTTQSRRHADHVNVTSTSRVECTRICHRTSRISRRIRHTTRHESCVDLPVLLTHLAFEHDIRLASFNEHHHVTFLRNDVHADNASASRAARRLQPPS